MAEATPETTPSIVLEWHDTVLYEPDLALLEPNEWLNDAIISFHYDFLEHHLFKSHSSDSILFMRPVMVALAAQSAESVESLKGILPPNLDTREWIFLPVSDGSAARGGGSHWSLLVWHRGSRSFFYFDSMGNSNLDVAKATAQRLMPLVSSVSDDKPDVPGFEMVPCPQQQNGSDCGVYVMAFTAYIAGTHLLPVVNQCKTAQPDIISHAPPTSVEQILADPAFAERALFDKGLMQINSEGVAKFRVFLQNTIGQIAEQVKAGNLEGIVP